MNFFRKMGIVVTMMFCSHNIFGQTTTSAYYEYEVECLGVELDGSQTLRIWGVGRNKKDAVEQAKKNAVRIVLFKGMIISAIWYRRSGRMVPPVSRCRIFHSGDVVPHQISFFDILVHQRV